MQELGSEPGILKNTMEIKRENVDAVNAILSITIEKSDYQETVEKALNDYRKEAVIPGFRKGKVPAGLIRQRVGKAILAEEVNKILSSSLSKYIVEEKLPMLGEPLPNETIQKPIDFDNDEQFEFVFDIGLTPEIKINLDKRSKYDYYTIKVDKEMIDNQLETIARQHGTYMPVDEVTEQTNVRGDFIQIDEEGTETEEGIRREGALLAVNRIKDEKIKKEFIGKKKDDTLVFNPMKAFQNRHEVSHLLAINHEETDNLNSEFTFTIQEISVFKPAEINEALIEKVYGKESGIQTMKEFRGKIKEELAVSLEQSSEIKFELDTRKTLLEKNGFELPEPFLKRWLVVNNKNLTNEQIDQDFDQFIEDLRWQIISDAIIKDNDLKVSKEEALELARQVALSQFQQYGMAQVPDEQLTQFAEMMLDKEEERERLYRKLYNEKIMDVVKEKTNIQEKEVSHKKFLEMMK